MPTMQMGPRPGVMAPGSQPGGMPANPFGAAQQQTAAPMTGHPFGRMGPDAGAVPDAFGASGMAGPAAVAARAAQHGVLSPMAAGPGAVAAPGMPAAAAGHVAMAEVDERSQCAPAYMAFTMGAMPKDGGMVQRAALPFGVCVHPLAEGEGSLGPGNIPLVDFGQAGVIRCKRCRAYVNPFTKFIDGGRRWKCNFCTYINDVPAPYFCPTDEAGNRTDAGSRPELSCGSVEIIAPVEYMVRPPQPPVYVFVIDVSYAAVSSGVLATSAAAIRSCLDRLPGGERTQVGFITFDTAVHFYSIKPNQKTAQMLVVPDIADLFMPAQPEVRGGCCANVSTIGDATDALAAYSLYCAGSACELDGKQSDDRRPSCELAVAVQPSARYRGA